MSTPVDRIVVVDADHVKQLGDGRFEITLHDEAMRLRRLLVLFGRMPYMGGMLQWPESGHDYRSGHTPTLDELGDNLERLVGILQGVAERQQRDEAELTRLRRMIGSFGSLLAEAARLDPTEHS
jgi:hypothetical protein